MYQELQQMYIASDHLNRNFELTILEYHHVVPQLHLKTWQPTYCGIFTQSKNYGARETAVASELL
jgi:hypothetical protein